jgi:hypothetical protein
VPGYRRQQPRVDRFDLVELSPMLRAAIVLNRRGARSCTIAPRFGIRNSCLLELDEPDLNVAATRVEEVPRIPLDRPRARVAPAQDIV